MGTGVRKRRVWRREEVREVGEKKRNRRKNLLQTGLKRVGFFLKKKIKNQYTFKGEFANIKQNNFFTF